MPVARLQRGGGGLLTALGKGRPDRERGCSAARHSFHNRFPFVAAVAKFLARFVLIRAR